MRVLLLSVVAMIAAQPAMAREAVEIDGWTIEPIDKSCVASADYDEADTDGEANFSIYYNAASREASLAFSNSKATSLADSAKVQLTIGFKFPNGDYKEDYGTNEFQVIVTDKGNRFFVSQTLPKKMMEDVAGALRVGFFVGDQVVSVFELDSSTIAITELKKCAFEVAGFNPLDPFLK